MIEYSEITGKKYLAEECVFFRNIYQCCFYISHHCYPVDIFVDSSGKLVMVFTRAEHNEMIKLWIANKENKDIKIE